MSTTPMIAATGSEFGGLIGLIAGLLVPWAGYHVVDFPRFSFVEVQRTIKSPA